MFLLVVGMSVTTESVKVVWAGALLPKGAFIGEDGWLAGLAGAVFLAVGRREVSWGAQVSRVGRGCQPLLLFRCRVAKYVFRRLITRRAGRHELVL